MIINSMNKVTDFGSDYISYIGLFRKKKIISYFDIDYILFDVPIQRYHLSEVSMTVYVNIYVGKRCFSRPIPFSLNGELEKFFRKCGGNPRLLNCRDEST